MKFLNFYNYKAWHLGSGSVLPDEMDYLYPIVRIVADHFCHSKLNFYIINEPNFSPKTNNNIIFASGESCRHLNTDNFLLCFTNFYNHHSVRHDKRYLPFPLGLNKFCYKAINEKYHQSIPIQDRHYKCFFAGFIHHSRKGFLNSLKKLSGNNLFHFTGTNNIQTFEKDLNPLEYLGIAANSKVILCPSGAVHGSSYRYFESLYLKSICIYNKNDGDKIFFEDENPLAYKVNSWDELSDDLIDSLIYNYNSFEQKFDKYFKEKVSNFSVAKYIIDQINNIEIN